MVEREMGREETSRRWSICWLADPAFRHLIDNPPVLPILEELLGAEFRLDHEYVDLIRSGMGPIGSRTARWGGSFSSHRVLLERRRPDAQWAGGCGLQPEGRRSR